MNLKTKTKLALSLFVTGCVVIPFASAAGLWDTLPIIGGQAYCAASNVNTPAQQTVTGTGGNPAVPPPPGILEGFPGNPPGLFPAVCQGRVPSGPRSFAGSENLPVDIYPPGLQSMAGGAQTALVKLTQLGQGAVLAVDAPPVAPATAIALQPNVAYAVLNSGLGATATVNLPNPAIDGEQISLVCNGGGTTLTLTPLTTPQNQVIAPTAPTTCPSGTVYKYRFIAAATGTIAADTWLRIQ